MSLGNTLAQTAEYYDHIYRPLKRGEESCTWHNDLFCWILLLRSFCHSCVPRTTYCSWNVTTVPALVPYCHCSPLSLEGESERKRSSIIVLWNRYWLCGPSHPGEVSPHHQVKHHFLNIPYCLRSSCGFQLKLLHGCDADGKRIASLSGSAKFSLFPLLCTNNERGQLSPRAQCTLAGIWRRQCCREMPSG